MTAPAFPARLDIDLGHGLSLRVQVASTTSISAMLYQRNSFAASLAYATCDLDHARLDGRDAMGPCLWLDRAAFLLPSPAALDRVQAFLDAARAAREATLSAPPGSPAAPTRPQEATTDER